MAKKTVTSNLTSEQAVFVLFPTGLIPPDGGERHGESWQTFRGFDTWLEMHTVTARAVSLAKRIVFTAG